MPCLSALRGKVATRQGVCHFYATQRRKRLGFQAVLASASDVSTASEFKILNKNVFEDLGADDRVTVSECTLIWMQQHFALKYARKRITL